MIAVLLLCRPYIMVSTLLLVVVASLFAVAEAHRHTGYLNSSVTLVTSFAKVIEVTWTHKNPPNESQVAKYQNGTITDRLDDRYKLSHDGRHLVIEDLTEKDNGVYIAVATLPNGTLVTETFHLMVLAEAPTYTAISGPLHSSIIIHTSFDKVIEVSWRRKDPPKEWQIVKVQNGNITDRLDDRYKPDCDGRALVIEHLTEKDNGVYIAEVTLPNGTLVKERFRLTVLDVSKRSRIPVVSYAVMALVVFAALMVWICCKRSPDTGAQNDENLPAPVQDTGIQESIFIEILHKKMSMKLEEEDEEGSKTASSPSSDSCGVGLEASELESVLVES